MPTNEKSYLQHLFSNSFLLLDASVNLRTAHFHYSLFELQVAMLRKHNSAVQSCQYDAEEVAKWSPTEVSKTTPQCSQEQQAHDEVEEGIGDKELRKLADATSGAFESGEAAENFPVVLFVHDAFEVLVTSILGKIDHHVDHQVDDDEENDDDDDDDDDGL